jgi:hypothetical protein
MRALLNGLAIMGLLAVAGCSSENNDAVSYDTAPVAETPDHSHEGPNGGEVIEFMDDHSYHAEVCMDETSRDVTVYIYGANLDTPSAIDGDGIEFEIDAEDGDEVEIEAVARPRDGESDGKSSVFAIAGAGIPESAKDLHDFHWHMHIRIGDNEYDAKLAHDEGEHTHAAGDGHEEGEGHDKDGDKHEHEEGEGHDKDNDKHEEGEGHDKDE